MKTSPGCDWALAFATADARSRCGDAGYSGFIQKPFMGSTLLSALEKILDGEDA